MSGGRDGRGKGSDLATIASTIPPQAAEELARRSLEGGLVAWLGHCATATQATYKLLNPTIYTATFLINPFPPLPVLHRLPKSACPALQ